ncbi:DUF6286 domain-containing protein [Streptomyces hydrogenans]|uniref:DUF6286 domain-containing protein n=1 Tax=Streptomyces hydrogenans TaxID=1873719 RepID=UPI0034404EDB
MNAPLRGVTTVADRVTARIARQAAAEATAPLGGQVLRGSASRTGRSVAVTVEVGLPLSAPADPDRMLRLRSHLVDRTGHLTGVTVTHAHIRIRALGVDPPSTRPSPRDAVPAPVTARGAWSRRRPAVACLALAVTALCGLLLWTVLSWYLPGTAESPWPRVEKLVRGTDASSFVRRGAVPAAALAGGWLLLLSLTPGHRRAPALGHTPPTHARMTRGSAARLVRGALDEVPGLRLRGVHFTPRRVTVRAETTSGAPEGVRAAATAAVAASVASLPLGRTPSVRLVLKDTRNPQDEKATDA